MSKIHQLKTLPEYFDAVFREVKKFEIRVNDRNFQVGDTLYLEEYTPEDGYTGREFAVTVTYIVQGVFGLPSNVCVMSIDLNYAYDVVYT